MGIYEFNILNLKEKLITVWDKGIFLDNYVTDKERINCYAIDMFFVEVVYDSEEIKIVEVRSFKEGYLLDKYSPNFKTKNI